MSLEERDRLAVLSRVRDGEIALKEAARRDDQPARLPREPDPRSR